MLGPVIHYRRTSVQFTFSSRVPSLVRFRRLSCLQLFKRGSQHATNQLVESSFLHRLVTTRAEQCVGCLNVKSEERVVYKRLNSTATLIQKTTMEAPHETLCITSDWMFTRRRSATA